LYFRPVKSWKRKKPFNFAKHAGLIGKLLKNSASGPVKKLLPGVIGRKCRRFLRSWRETINPERVYAQSRKVQIEEKT